jgi:HK97 family phage prohead protease
MDVIRKDATITNTDDAFPGSFEVILSAPTKDRDGETLLPTEWKQPLPDHITFDQDHGMSVASTVGSGVPRLEADGTLRVKGTYSSLPRAQEVRTLVKEGHINRTSVAFMSEKTQKDGVTAVQRELLNGAFVAIPANREAVVLDAKGIKAGARNSASDQVHLDAIARHAIALGATITTGDDPQGGDSGANPDVAAAKGLRLKDADTEDASDPVALISATDAAIDQAIDLLAQVDVTTLPAEVQQAIALIQAADASVDELMDALGIPDPDEDADTSADPASTPATRSVAPVATPTAPVEDHSFDQQLVAARKRFYTTLNEGN